MDKYGYCSLIKATKKVLEKLEVENKTAALITSSGYSKPISREIMRIYKDLELVEHLGSGLNRILTAYGKESFQVRANFMRNIFYTNQKILNDPVNEVIKLLLKNNTLSYDSLALALNKSKATVKRNIQKLKSDGLLRRVGSDKSGHWEVLESD